MPTELPDRRRHSFNRWHLAGIVIGFIAVTGAMFWIAAQRAPAPELVTTGIAPASQSGKRLIIE